MLKYVTGSRRKARLRSIPLLAVPLSLVLTGFLTPSVQALDSDDVGVYGSVTVSRSAQTAAKAMKKGSWAEAQGEYKKLIGMSPNQEDFYFGLYEASHKMQQWNECAGALSQLFDLKPAYKDQMALEYGECMFHMNRYEEAEPYLKKALANIAQPSIVESKLRRLMDKSIIDYTPQVGKILEYKEPEKFVRPERAEKMDVSQVAEDTSEKSLTFLNAFMKSESVVVAEYKGYDKSNLISFYNPPKANFRIVEYLKGPPLNKALPIRYEFTRKLSGDEKPKDWKFADYLVQKY